MYEMYGDSMQSSAEGKPEWYGADRCDDSQIPRILLAPGSTWVLRALAGCKAVVCLSPI